MSLFAVFDGHGGGEVARFAERHFAQELVNNENFPKKKYEQALSETFFKIDKMLQTAEGEKQLKKIKKELIDKQNSEGDEDKSYAGKQHSYTQDAQLSSAQSPKHRSMSLMQVIVEVCSLLGVKLKR